MENEKKIIEALKKAKKALKAGEIAEITKLDKKDVDTAMKNLKKTGSIVSPKACYWESKK